MKELNCKLLSIVNNNAMKYIPAISNLNPSHDRYP